MEQYRKIGYLFEDLLKRTVSRSREKRKPGGQDAEYVVLGTEIWTLDDGTELELCAWSEDDMGFWDVSADMERFSGSGEFLRFLSDMGLPLENIEDESGRWKYCGLSRTEDLGVYRVQYYQRLD